MCECLMLSTPLRKLERSPKMPILFLAINLSVYILLVLFLFPLYLHKALIWLSSVVQLLMMVFWLKASYTNPGHIKRPTDIDFLNLLQLIDPVQICPDCQIVRTPRSRHCGCCNQCIERFDHHCPWINNCVGINNHRAFMCFLIFMASSVIINFSLSIVHIIDANRFESWPQIYSVFSHSVYENKKLIITLHSIVLVISAVFIGPITLLLFI